MFGSHPDHKTDGSSSSEQHQLDLKPSEVTQLISPSLWVTRTLNTLSPVFRCGSVHTAQVNWAHFKVDLSI